MPKALRQKVGSIVALAAVGCFATLVSPASAAAKQKTPFAVPPGITLIEIPQAESARAGMLRAASYSQRYANDVGMVLYTSDRDIQAGKSTCDAECRKTWVPVEAPANAQTFGHWSVIAGNGGAKQWAFKGKPVYTYVGDKEPGESKGATADGAWHTISLERADGIETPFGIALQDVEDATGISLVDINGMPLYFLEGQLKNGDQALSSEWLPLRAPMIAHAVGDFTRARMHDGTDQWAFKGKRLYTFKSDVRRGDAKGIGVDPRLQVALVARYFMPDDVVIRKNVSRGTILVNKATGTALYRRDSYHQTIGGFYARSSNSGTPSDGRRVGVRECDENCTQTWPPLVAPANAKAQDFWTILTRPDGTKQWAYKGFALYSYTGDQQPGDMKGDNNFTYLITQVANRVSESGLPFLAVYWHVVFP